jgi:colanic acid/amylovoran biosynthesis glycosyltransferase
MKILYLIHKFPEISQAFIRNQLRDMASRGHDISIVCIFDETGKFSTDPSFESPLFNPITYGEQYPSSVRQWLGWGIRQVVRILRSPQLLKTLWHIRRNDIVRQTVLMSQILHYRRLTRAEPDIIHVHFADNAVAVAALQKSGILADSRLVVTFHGYDLQKFSAAYYRLLFEQADAFSVNSQYSGKKAAALGCPEDKINVIPVSFNSEFFKPEPHVSHSGIRIIYVGRLCEFKGAHIALEAFYELSRKIVSQVHFDIVGAGELTSELKKRIAELNLNKSVTLHGALHQNRIKELMNAADIFLFPGITDKNGRQENQGLVVQEAQAMELPVLASNVGGISEGLLDNVTGFLIPEQDISALVEKLIVLCSDDTLRRQMGNRGRAFVLGNYSLEVIGDKIENLYKELARG